MKDTSILTLRKDLDEIIGPMRRKAFFKWLMGESTSKYLMYVTSEIEADTVSKRLCAAGIVAGFAPSANYPQQYTVWISA